MGMLATGRMIATQLELSPSEWFVTGTTAGRSRAAAAAALDRNIAPRTRRGIVHPW
jgi:hypothetical protein